MKITDECVGCMMCIDAEICPNEAIIIIRNDPSGYGRVDIDKSLCSDCGLCLDFDCPAYAFKEEEVV